MTLREFLEDHLGLITEDDAEGTHVAGVLKNGIDYDLTVPEDSGKPPLIRECKFEHWHDRIEFTVESI